MLNRYTGGIVSNAVNGLSFPVTTVEYLVVAGGGGAGASNAGNASGGAGGAGGLLTASGYAITLGSVITVTVGAGGAGGAAGTNPGVQGSNSVFGVTTPIDVTAPGGGGGGAASDFSFAFVFFAAGAGVTGAVGVAD